MCIISCRADEIDKSDPLHQKAIRLLAICIDYIYSTYNVR